MPEISRFYGIIISMYFEDHPPPPFHADYDGEKAVIDINKLEICQGELPRRARKMVLEWAKLHQAELLDAWNTQTLVKIPPLK